jgi:hypothetical protein
MTQPASPNSIIFANAYQNVLVPGDQMYLVDYQLNYTNPFPSYTASQSYIVNVVSSTNIQLAGTSIFSYVNSGYQNGVAIVYFGASSAPTWNNGEQVQLVGNPTLTWTGTPPSTTHAIGNWVASASVSNTNTLLSNEVIAVSGSSFLGSSFTAAGVNLLMTAGAGGQVLNTAVPGGQQYWQGVFPQIAQAAPQAMAISVSNPTLLPSKMTGSTAEQATLLLQPLGTILDFSAFAILMGFSVVWLDTIIVFAFIFILDFFIMWGFNKVKVATGYGNQYTEQRTGGTGTTKGILMLDVMIMILASVLGMFSLIVTVGIAVLCVFIVAFIVFLNKSGA